jgi:hypothetical protein
VKYPEVTQAHYDAADRVLLPTAANSLRDRIALAVAYAEQRGEKRAAPSPDTRLEAWIKCSERMPENGRLVLLARAHRSPISSGVGSGWYDSERWYWQGAGHGETVTHWMPPPAPPAADPTLPKEPSE